MSCTNNYPCATNPYGNIPGLPYGYQGKNTLVKIVLGVNSSDLTVDGDDFRVQLATKDGSSFASNNQIGGISILSVNLRGYGNINYGSTNGAGSVSNYQFTESTAGTAGANPTGGPPSLLTSRSNGVPLYIREQTVATDEGDLGFGYPKLQFPKGKPTTGLCLQIPCGVNSFEIVTMVWNLPGEGLLEDASQDIDGRLDSPYSTGYSAWVAVWHVDLTKCSVTAVSWTRVLSENPVETASNFDHTDKIMNNKTPCMNGTLSKCCCSCTSNCCAKTNSPSDLEAVTCPDDCTNIIKLFAPSCNNCFTGPGCC